jgi:hypothetical protein
MSIFSDLIFSQRVAKHDRRWRFMKFAGSICNIAAGALQFLNKITSLVYLTNFRGKVTII